MPPTTPSTTVRPGISGKRSRQDTRHGGDNSRRGPQNRRTSRREPVRSEYDHKLLNVRRVTRVVAGGRRFNFSVAVVIGNRKGVVGVGLGKAGDTAAAIEKAQRDARKHLVRVALTHGSIAHDIAAKYCAAQVTITPAPGHGLVAGSSIRSVLELAGISDVTAKVLSRSKNRLNNARAAVKALASLRHRAGTTS